MNLAWSDSSFPLSPVSAGRSGVSKSRRLQAFQGAATSQMLNGAQHHDDRDRMSLANDSAELPSQTPPHHMMSMRSSTSSNHELQLTTTA